MHVPVIVTIPSSTKPAIMAGLHTSPADPRYLTGQTDHHAWIVLLSGIAQEVPAHPHSQPARLDPMHLMIQGIGPIPTCHLGYTADMWA